MVLRSGKIIYNTILPKDIKVRGEVSKVAEASVEIKVEPREENKESERENDEREEKIE